MTKFDATGSPVWSREFTSAGAPSDDRPTRVAVDAQRNVYVSGLSIDSSAGAHNVATLRYSQPAPISTICPSGAPPFALSTLRLYRITGMPAGIPWSWCIRSNDNWAPFTDICDFNTPGVASGSAFDLTQAFANDVNAQATTNGCSSSELRALALGGIIGPNHLVIQTGRCTSFDLWVGPAGGPPDCLVPLLPTMQTCSFNPEIVEIPLAGLDCNRNAVDDTVDLAAGTSVDDDESGIPDECESLLPAPGDCDGSSAFNGLDIQSFLNCLLSGPGPGCECADINADGAIDAIDILLSTNQLLYF